MYAMRDRQVRDISEGGSRLEQKLKMKERLNFSSNFYFIS
jgi:hypothetical protein